MRGVWRTYRLSNEISEKEFSRCLPIIAIPSATLLTKEVRGKMEEVRDKLSISFHMYPDCDAPGERLFLQLREVLPSLVHHQLPPGCKDFGDYYKGKQ